MSTPLIISEVLAKSDLLVDRPTIDAVESATLAGGSAPKAAMAEPEALAA